MARRRPGRSHNEEDETLSHIAKEAEKRLAEKRRARIEAREIRMRELQRQAEEKGEDYCDDAVSKASQTLKTPSVTSKTVSPVYNHSNSSSFSGSDPGVITTDNIQDLKNALTQLEEKYRQAMVQSAQLDNERAQLHYQTELLKDLLEEEEDDFYRLSAEHRSTCQELERQKRAFSALQKKCYDLQESLQQRDELIQEQGLVVVGDGHQDAVDGPERNDNDCVHSKIALVTPEAAEVLLSAGKGSLDVQLKMLAEEKQYLLDQVRQLKLHLDEERQKEIINGGSESSQHETKIPEMQLLEIQRDANKQVTEYKLKLQKSEQDFATCQNHIARLEGQLQRLRQTAETYEKNEDEMRADKRRLMRDLRTALDRIEEMEMTNSHLEKRLERIRASRTALSQT